MKGNGNNRYGCRRKDRINVGETNETKFLIRYKMWTKGKLEVEIEKGINVMLKIKFWRIENVILMKILEQGDEIKRGNFEFEASNGVNLHSRLEPTIYDKSISLRGKDISQDKQVVSKYFNTAEEAKEHLKAYIEAVREYNNSLQQPAAEDVEDVETVIAE